MTDRTLGVFIAMALTVSTVILIGIAPPAVASHDAGSNFTVQPVDASQDRSPGISDASYKQFAHANRSIKRIDYFVVEWQAGVIGSCDPSNIEALGIDRGDDDPGTKTDEGLLAHVEDTKRSKHRVVADFYDQGDLGGESTHINASDELVSHQSDCYGNPDEPGWYQITATVNGTDWQGNHIEMTVSSHYFWICDCASEQEARNQLGPPPSENTGTSTQSPGSTTATSTQVGSTPTPTTDSSQAGTPKTTDGSQTETSTPRRTQTETSSVATATRTAVGTGSGTTVTATPSEAAVRTETSPSPTTAGDGPGFGVLITVLAVFAVLMVKMVR